MVLILKHRSFDDFAGMSPQDTAALLAQARTLQSAARSGTPQSALRGKNLGLLCATADDAEAVLFKRAASALGAHVAFLRPSLSEQSAPQEVQHTARVLGRLYVAVCCVGMTAGLVRRIAADAGVPVFEGIASPLHPTAPLAESLDPGTAPDDNRCLVIQAVLLSALAD